MPDNSVSCGHSEQIVQRRPNTIDAHWCTLCGATKHNGEAWTKPNRAAHTLAVNHLMAAKRPDHMDAQLLDLRHRVTVCETHIKCHGDENGSYAQQLYGMAKRIGDLQKFVENLEANDRRRAVAVRKIQSYLQNGDNAGPLDEPEDAPGTLYVVVDTGSDCGCEDFFAAFVSESKAQAFVDTYPEAKNNFARDPNFKIITVDLQGQV